MLSLKRLLFLTIGLLINSAIYSQAIATTEFKTSSSLDQEGLSLILLNESIFLFHTVKGEPAKSDANITFYYGYTDILYKMTVDFRPFDSVMFPPFQGYGLRLYGMLRLIDNVIVASGTAYDSISGDYQIYMAWLNDDLEIVEETIIGNSEVNEGLFPPRANKMGNLVQFGWYPENPDTGMRQYFYMEFSPMGELLNFVEDSSALPRFDIVSFGNQGKYAQYSSDNITILNSDFTLNKMVEVSNLNNFTLRSFGFLNDSTFYAGGRYQVDSPNFDLDPAVVPIGLDGYVFPIVHFGAVDTADFFSTFKVIKDGFLLAGTKNAYPGIPSYLMINKLDTTFEKVNVASYGDGIRAYILNDVIALTDGGCIATGKVQNYDPRFLYNIRNDIVLVRFDAEGVIVGQTKVLSSPSQITLIPNPATNRVMVSDRSGCWTTVEIFDMKGGSVSRQSVENCRFFDVRHLPTGIYLVSLMSETGIKVFVRLIKV